MSFFKTLNGILTLVGAAILIALVIWFGKWNRDQGAAARQKQWDASVKRGEAEVKRLQEAAGRVTTKVEIKYVERIKTVEVKGATIVKYRDRYVPDNSGMLSGGFRLYHDAAAANKDDIPDTAIAFDAAPVAIADVADTIGINYALCHKAYEVVAGWQEWATEQCKLNDNGCPVDGR